MATNYEMKWADLGSTSNIKFLKLEGGKMGNRVRVVSNPAKIDVHWESSNGSRKKVNCLGATCPICQHGGHVQTKYQVLVLDKTEFGTDSGYGPEGPQVKVLETGVSVMRAIQELVMSADYGDTTKYDIIIKKEGTGKDTRYTVLPSPKRSDLTAEEISVIKAAPAFSEINRVPTIQEVMDMDLDILGGVSNETEMHTVHVPTPAATVTEPVAQKPAEKAAPSVDDDAWAQFN